MAQTKIEWSDNVWNCIRGCSLVSDGCRNCYAMRQAHRFSREGQPYHGLTVLSPTGPKWNGDIQLVPDKLGEPLRWRKPCRVFVNSMSDVFHEGVDDSFIDRIFGVMALCPQHTFQILTKRPERMMRYMNEPGRGSTVMTAAAREAFDQATLAARHGRFPKTADYIPRAEQDRAFETGRSIITVKDRKWPLENVWLGTSVENQKTFEERMPFLIATMTAIRWVSMEPLLGPINANVSIQPCGWTATANALANVHWVVVGGESGPGARPVEADWVRNLMRACKGRGISFFFKQWGQFLPAKQDSVGVDGGAICNITDKPAKVGKHTAGRLLDGREWNEYPFV